LQADYAHWLDALPDATRDGATAEALQTIVDLDLDDIVPPSLHAASAATDTCHLAAKNRPS
jgi:hypothetical protein